MPVSKEKLTQTLASELSVPAKKTYYYDLIITLNNLDVDQESDKEAVYNTHFNVDKPLQYRYYTLLVDPNGGTWGEFTTNQSYLLKNNETLKNIENPTRVGYTFGGWELKGTSSTYDSGTFTMGISDASLTAKWTAEKYTVTIDPDGGEYPGDKELQVDYGSTVTLSEPTKTGYTFSHWETTGGTLSDNTLTITNPSDVTVIAKWTPNKYSYIVRHNKQNIDGNGYTTYETETDLESDYGSTVTPEFKEYDGFTQPTEKKTITIKEDTSLNIVEYNYTRNKYTLTVNPDGGTGGTQTQEVYYENTIDLVAPTKTSYNFQKWTVESGTGTISDNTFKMGIGATRILANWKEQEYSLTFNPNGGTVNPGSKKITYNTLYGELPTPTRKGYIFDGWYTTNEKTGGEEITSSTPVTITSNQTLYARWNHPNMLLAVSSDKYVGEIWEYKADITKVIFKNTASAPSGYTKSYDVSNDDDRSVMAYLVTDSADSTKYIAYIQSNGRIYANEDSSYLFCNFTNLKSIEGLEYLDTSEVTNMQCMFRLCQSLTSLNVSNFDTSKVTDMLQMFYRCSSLTNLDVSSFKTSNVTMIALMFDDCSNLTSLDVSNFDTSNVTNMNAMFGNCAKLTTLDVSNFNTSNVTTMSGMFNKCSSLTSLDVSNFNTSNVTNMGTLFYGCSGITSLNVSNFDTKKVTNMEWMFYGCSSLTSLDVSNFNTSNVTTMALMFEACTNLTSLDLSNFDTKKVTNMEHMFAHCTCLTSLNISSFDTKNVTNMSWMFTYCEVLVNLNLSNFITNNVTNMSYMFLRCKKLKQLDLSHFDTKNVTNMQSMFNQCSSLTNVNISSFDTSNVTDMNLIFNDCNNLTSLDLSNFNTSKVINMDSLFANCSKLTTLNLSNWIISTVSSKKYIVRSVPSSIKITVNNPDIVNWIIEASDYPKLSTSNFVVS